MANSRVCSIPDCGKPINSRGWCANHYRRARLYGDPLGGEPFRPGALKFLRGTLSVNTKECIQWPFYRDKLGYGKITYKGRVRYASRLVCEMAHGEPPSSRHNAAHSCGNGHLGCVNPNHLRWATQLENGADMIKHGRSPRGNHHQAKITVSDVRRIRSLYKKLPPKTLALEYGITRGSIYAIQHRHRWEWVED